MNRHWQAITYLSVWCWILLIGTYSEKVQAKEDGPSLDREDWKWADRMCWQNMSALKTLAEIDSQYPNRCGQTFLTSAIHNTKEKRPLEYTTIRQRFDYYDIMSYQLVKQPSSLGELNKAKFFIATAMVTTSPGLGAADNDQGNTIYSAGAAQTIQLINMELFAKNIDVINQLLFVKKALYNPNTAQPLYSALKFDMAMVQYEQRAVDAYLRSHKIGDATLTEINTVLNSQTGSGFDWSQPNKSLLLFVGSLTSSVTGWTWLKDARAAIGEPINFGNTCHRMLMGAALVAKLHKVPIWSKDDICKTEIYENAPTATAPPSPPALSVQ